MSAASSGGVPAKAKTPDKKRAGKDKADQPAVPLENERSLSPETMRQQLEWEREEQEAEEKRLAEEKRKRQELEEIRRAEADQRKARDRARLAEEEEVRREANDRQKMLESLERPVVELLEEMECFEALAMVLAQQQILSLKTLLNIPRADLAEMVSSPTDLTSLDRVVIAARRAVALEDIAELQLPEDAEWEAKAAAKHKAEKALRVEKNRQREQGYGQVGGKKKKGGLSRDSKEDMNQELTMAEQIARKYEKEEDDRPPAGPLRNELCTVVNRWYDYLATVPSLGEFLARTTTGYEVLRRKRKTKDDYDDEDDDDDDDEEEEDEAKVKAKAARAELKAKREELLQANQRNNGALALRNGSHICGDVGTAGPTWKHTVSWALWMLTTKQQRMSRKQIERQLKLAQDHVWRALYPGLELLSCAEWRVYWQRVKSSFDSFFSDRGTDKWKQVAAADARAKAILEGKSVAEQEAAALKAERMVFAMLHPKREPQRQQEGQDAQKTRTRQSQQSGDGGEQAESGGGGGLWGKMKTSFKLTRTKLQAETREGQSDEQQHLNPSLVLSRAMAITSSTGSPPTNLTVSRTVTSSTGTGHLPNNMTISRTSTIGSVASTKGGRRGKKPSPPPVPPEVVLAVAERFEQVATDSPTRFARYDSSPIRFATTPSRYMDALLRPQSHHTPRPTLLPFGDRSPRRIPIPQLLLMPPPKKRLHKARSASAVLEGRASRSQRSSRGGQRSYRAREAHRV